MVGCSWIPGPHGLAAKEEDRASDNSDTVQTTGASHTTHANVLGRSSWGYTFEASNRDGSRLAKEVVVHGRSGGRRSRGDVEEVVVHGDGSSTSRRRSRVVVEVVVHVRFKEVLDASEVSEGDGSGTW